MMLKSDCWFRQWTWQNANASDWYYDIGLLIVFDITAVTTVRFQNLGIVKYLSAFQGFIHDVWGAASSHVDETWYPTSIKVKDRVGLANLSLRDESTPGDGGFAPMLETCRLTFLKSLVYSHTADYFKYIVCKKRVHHFIWNDGCGICDAHQSNHEKGSVKLLNRTEKGSVKLLNRTEKGSVKLLNRTEKENASYNNNDNNNNNNNNNVLSDK